MSEGDRGQQAAGALGVCVSCEGDVLPFTGATRTDGGKFLCGNCTAKLKAMASRRPRPRKVRAPSSTDAATVEAKPEPWKAAIERAAAKRATAERERVNRENALSRHYPEPEPVPGARWLSLGHGNFALVDERDYHRVEPHRWHKEKRKRTATRCAA